MRYMVIEHYRHGPKPVYERAASRGRLLPDGLTYVDSWIEESTLTRCFQLMETDDPGLFDAWIADWADIVDFEVIPVVSSPEARARSGADQPPGLPA